jgi:tetratricopeptide (TPR) repeat protein
MSASRALCLNMIVKNEMANLERCLASVAPHIDCWVIADTGSSDFIRSFFAARGLPGELHSLPFVNFEQARNGALEAAYASPLAFDYLLLTDADMELVVEDNAFRDGLDAACYRLLQRSSISYWNARIVRRDAGARYRGVTHEYLETPGNDQKLEGVWFVDHASGSNRADKFERDIALLKAALDTDPDNLRYRFYLAQSLRDAGRTAEAAEAYARRAEMGGWDEEAWHSRLSEARCLLALGDEAGFVRQALAAFDQRPHRAEPLYDLAHHYRERGMNAASVLFAEAGLALPWPVGDSLFVEDFVYQAGLREEYSIAGYYAADPARKARAFALCNGLALDREAPAAQRSLARQNLRFYAPPAAELLPSFAPRPVGFEPPAGWRAMNPSVARWGERLMLLQRTVNYVLRDDGSYEMAESGRIETRNFLLGLGADLNIETADEVLPPADLPSPCFPTILGFEDARLFAWRGNLWCSSTVRELSPRGWCQQVLARIDQAKDGPMRLADWAVMSPREPIRHEKNWMPLVANDWLRFVYSCDPTRLVDETGLTTSSAPPPIAADAFRGGSQAVEFDGGWLVVIHEVPWFADYGDRCYQHRLVSLDSGGQLRGASRPFYFKKVGVEFAAGLAWLVSGERLVVSYGIDDRESWLATVDASDVRAALQPV